MMGENYMYGIVKLCKNEISTSQMSFPLVCVCENFSLTTSSLATEVRLSGYPSAFWTTREKIPIAHSGVHTMGSFFKLFGDPGQEPRWESRLRTCSIHSLVPHKNSTSSCAMWRSDEESQSC